MAAVRLFSPEGRGQPSLTVGDVASAYLRHASGENSPALAERKRVIDAFVRHYGTMPVSECKAFHLQLWVEDHPDLLSNWTKRRWTSSVRVAFTWAAKLGMIDRNPFAAVSFPKGERGYPVEPSQFRSMLRSTTALFRRVLTFLKFTGCRPGEMASARWTDIDYERGCIVLEKHKTRKRTGKPRIIMLHPVVVKLLLWIRRNNPHPQLVFVNSKREPWTRTAIAWRVKQIRQAADVPPDATLYCCRHAFGTDAVLAGVDLATLAALMGHSRVETTMTYVHVAKRVDHLQSALGKIFTRH